MCVVPYTVGSVIKKIHLGGAGSSYVGGYSADVYYDTANQKICLQNAWSIGSTYVDLIADTRLVVRYR